MVSRLKALPHPSCGCNLCNLTLRDEPVVNTGHDRTERDNTPTGSTPRGIRGRRLCERFFESCVLRDSDQFNGVQNGSKLFNLVQDCSTRNTELRTRN